MPDFGTRSFESGRCQHRRGLGEMVAVQCTPSGHFMGPVTSSGTAPSIHLGISRRRKIGSASPACRRVGDRFARYTRSVARPSGSAWSTLRARMAGRSGQHRTFFLRTERAAAGNRDSDRAPTTRMPTPLRNRFVHIDFEVDVQEWCEWAIKTGIRPEVIAFIRFRSC